MKRKTYIAFLSAAVAAVALGGSQKSSADILQWDASGNSAPTYTDGAGTWNTSTPNWVDTSTGTQVVWTDGNSAQFGNPSPTASINGNGAYNIELANSVTTQDLTFGTGADGTPYGIINADDAVSLTINGNITKTTSGGNLQINMYYGDQNVILGPGDHTIAANDTGGDAAPELAFYAPISGSGNVIIDNGSYVQWGTTAFIYGNSYTGTTLINKGRLVIGDPNALGSTSAGTTIANQGALWIGGDIGQVPSMNLSEPITITRNIYVNTATNTDYADYPDAIMSANTGQPGNVLTLSNLTIDSTDARIAADTSTIVIPNPLVAAADVDGTAMADFDGDFAGFVDLNGDNTAFAATGNAIGIMGGVEVNASTIQNLGGTGSKLVLNGGFLHITSALVSSDPNIVNNFGAGTSHNVNTSSVSTGVDLDSGITFNVSNLSGGGVGERGTGTLNFSGTNNFSSGNPFFDGGIINFQAGSSTSQGSIGVRSATVNIDGALTLGSNTDSIGDSATGTNGGPDMATINISTTGSMVETGTGNVYVSNGANTKGTINMTGNAVLTTGNITELGVSNGAVGTINQYGGALTVNRNGNFGFVIADGRNSQTPTGVYNLMSGTFSDPAGEIYVGEGDGSGTAWGGTWNQTGGTATFGSWFVVGREGGIGTVNISGGSLTKTGTVGADSGSNISIGEGSSNVNTVNVTGTGTLTENDGEFYVGNNSGVGVLNIGTAAGAATGADATASVTVNNWLAVGRNGTSTGTVNLYDGTLTQATANWFDIAGDGGSPTATVNVYGGTLNAYQLMIGENGSGRGTLNIDGGTVNLPNVTVLANADSATGTINLNGGTLTSYSIEAHNNFLGENGVNTSSAILDFNGGTLVASKATSTSTALVGAKVTSVVSTGGAKINTNGFASVMTSALTHDSSLSGADGGLTKLGTGTLTLTGANTYTGATTISAGTLQYTGNNNQTLSSLSIANGAALDLSGGGIITVNSGLTDALSDIQAAYDNGAWDGTSSTSALITSAYAEAHPSIGLGIGYATSGDVTTLRLTWDGDTDLNGTVTAAEIDAITPMASGGTWATGDFNYDGIVNADDISLAQLGIAESKGNNITQTVPEPGLAMLALPMLIGFMPRRSRRR